MIRVRARRRNSRLGNHGGLHHKPHLRNSQPFTDDSLFDGNTTLQPIGIGYKNGELCFVGDSQKLLQQCTAMLPQARLEINTLNIFMNQQLIQKQNTICIVLIFVLGLIFCGLPWLLLRWSVFKLRYRSLFETSINQYDALARVIMLFTHVTKILITFKDNRLIVQKLTILEQAVRLTRISQLQLCNNCRALNLQQDQLLSITHHMNELNLPYKLYFNWQHINISRDPHLSEESQINTLL